jgi:competence protein ComEA
MKKLFLICALFSANVFATPVNINTADAKTISEALAGIGMKKAEAIVAYRIKNGSFKTIDDLKRVSGIGVKTFTVNKADILLSDSQSDQPTAKVASVTSEPALPKSNNALKVFLSVTFFLAVSITYKLFRKRKTFFKALAK